MKPTPHAALLSAGGFESDLMTFRRQAERDCLYKQLLSVSLLVTSVILYLGIGTVYFSNAQGWTAFDSFYFCVVTLGTVGFGGEGLEPDQPSTKIFCIVYIYVGILLILSRAGSLVDNISHGTSVKLNAIAEHEALTSGMIKGGRVKKQVDTSYGTAGGTLNRQGTSRTLEMRQLCAADIPEPPPVWRYYGVNVLILNAMLFGWILVAALIFCWTEKWKLAYVDSVFFVFITATTLGYGDAELTTAASRGWCCAFILLSTSIFTAMIAYFATLRTRRDLELRRWEVASQTKHASLLTDELMYKLDRSSTDGRHDRCSFLVEMLVHTDLVQRVEVNLLLEYFELLDKDKSGSLEMSELAEECQRVKRAAVAQQSWGQGS